MAEAVRWARRGVNTISSGIVFTPIARDELFDPRGEGYRRIIDLSQPDERHHPDQVGTQAALLMGPDWRLHSPAAT